MSSGTSKTQTTESPSHQTKPPKPAVGQEAGQAAAERNHRGARIMGELLVPAALHGITALEEVGPGGARVYLEDFIAQAAQVADPLEKLLLQHAMLLHVRLLRLHEQASQVKSLEGIKIVNAAAARLARELRQMVLTIRTYRSPVGPKSVAFIKQQNVAQEQQVRFEDRGPSEETIVNGRTELVDSEQQEPGYGRLGRAAQEPAMRGSGKEAATVDI